MIHKLSGIKVSHLGQLEDTLKRHGLQFVKDDTLTTKDGLSEARIQELWSCRIYRAKDLKGRFEWELKQLLGVQNLIKVNDKGLILVGRHQAIIIPMSKHPLCRAGMTQATAKILCQAGIRVPEDLLDFPDQDIIHFFTTAV